MKLSQDYFEVRSQAMQWLAAPVGKRNQLLYQSNAKQAEENPMPESPKRMKLQRQVESLTAELSKVEYELASRS